ncbi:hypothetical protein [Rubrivirga sp.]|uniref:hypothetical protein n=1 Tax=Rubrivirga sp. TaxID=1885344 RepID=UPI003C71F319
MIRVLALVFLVTATVSAQDLGETSFENSGLEVAQEPFLRGLLLLHSFEYVDARDAFQEARRLDPDFAMAAWGEAMTHNHPIWQRQDRDAARAALEDVDWSGASEREQAYAATLDVLFGEGDKEARDDAYAEAMEDLAMRYPDDLDAQSFYALALLGTAHEGRDFTVYMKAAAVAEEVFDVNPRHPGAAHYLIHAYDDPVHAPLGLRPARVYADVALAASHALHMPSHIYLALGMWEDVAEMNERSYRAAKAGSDRRGEALNGHGWHALWWWHYATTQLDQQGESARLLEIAKQHVRDDEDGSTAIAHVARMASAHASAYGDVTALDDPALAPSALESVGLTTRAIRWLPTVVDWIEAERLEDASAWVEQFALEVDASEDPSWTVRSALAQLQGRLLIAQGALEDGLARLQHAAALEAEAPLTFGPPAPVVPSNEAYGHALLEAGRDLEAESAFRAVLDRAPNRRQAVAGVDAARSGR